MKTRTILLAAAATVALAGSAQAAPGWYLAIDVGANMIQDNHFDFGTAPVPTITDFNNAADYDTGWALTGSAGWGSSGGWRFEAELGYRANDVDLFSSAVAASLFREGEVSQFTVMANVLYDIPATADLSFSLGGGLGLDVITIDDGIIERGEGTFAWQAIAGANWALTADTDLTLTYRYLTADGPSVNAAHVGSSPAHLDTYKFDTMNNHSLSVGIRFR
jgi:opacity protein-like surface antigen